MLGAEPNAKPPGAGETEGCPKETAGAGAWTRSSAMLSSMLSLFPGDAANVELPNMGCEGEFVEEVEPNKMVEPPAALGVDPKTTGEVLGAAKEDKDAPNVNAEGVEELNEEVKPVDLGNCQLDPKVPAVLEACEEAEVAPTLSGLRLTMLPAFVKEDEELAPKLKMPGVALVEVLPAFAGEVEELLSTLNMPGVAEVLMAFVEEDDELPPKLNIRGVVLLEMLTAFVEEAEEIPLKLNIPRVALLEVAGTLVFEGGAAELAPKANANGAIPLVGPVELPAALEVDELAPNLTIPEAALLEPTRSLFEGEAEI